MRNMPEVEGNRITEGFNGREDVVRILNSIMNVLHWTTIEHTNFEDDNVSVVLYLGHEEIHAINSIVESDLSIERDLKSGETKLYGWPVIPVMKESYARATVCVNLETVVPCTKKGGV